MQSTIAVTYSLQLEDVLNAILEQIHRTIPFKLANIALLEGKNVRVVDQLAFDALEKPKTYWKIITSWICSRYGW